MGQQFTDFALKGPPALAVAADAVVKVLLTVPGFNVPPEKLDPLALRAGDLGLPTPAGVSLISGFR